MKYLILIYGNPQSRAVWQSFSSAQRAEGLAYYAALTEDLAASGELIVSHALADPSLTRRVPALEGQWLATDGPFAEVKEQLAGFFLIECPSMDRALEIAARIPEAAFGLVEVRPIMALSDFEL